MAGAYAGAFVDSAGRPLLPAASSAGTPASASAAAAGGSGGGEAAEGSSPLHNASMRLYGGAQFHRAMTEFR